MNLHFGYSLTIPLLPNRIAISVLEINPDGEE